MRGMGDSTIKWGGAKPHSYIQVLITNQNQKTMVIIIFMSEGKLVTKPIDMDDLPWYLANTTVYKTKPIG